MPGVGTGPGPDAFTLSDSGRGRLGRRRGRPTILERRTSEGWVEVARYGSNGSAAAALDDAIASGTSPTDLRLTVVPRSLTRIVLTYAAILLVVVAAVAALSVVFFGS
jgi:hypothetical protein